MLLKFIGFPDGSWKRDEPASVDGFGEIKKGRVKNYPDDPENDIAEFLLATKNFVPATEDDLKASQAAEQEEVDAQEALLKLSSAEEVTPESAAESTGSVETPVVLQTPTS